MKFNTARKGFTLIELLVVIVVIAILATLAISNFGNVPAQGRDADRQSDMRQFSQQLVLYGQDNGHYPLEADLGADADAAAAHFEAESTSANLNPDVVVDPNDGFIGDADSEYTYTPLADDGSECTTDATTCTGGYTLTAEMETEDDDFQIDGSSVN